MVCGQAGFFSAPFLASKSRSPRARLFSSKIRKKLRLFYRLREIRLETPTSRTTTDKAGSQQWTAVSSLSELISIVYFELTCTPKHALPHHVFGDARRQSVAVGVSKSKRINVAGQGQPKHLNCLAGTCLGGDWELGGITWEEGTESTS